MGGMLGLVAVLAAGGIHLGWVAEPSAEPVATVSGLTVGEKVHVKDVHGRSVNGAIAEASMTALTIIEGGRSIIVASDEVQTVRRQDSVVNGVLLGLAGGLVGWYVGAGRVCNDDAAFCALAIAFPVSLGGGAAIGAGIDAVMHATLYSRPDRLRVRIAPAVSDSGVGARLSVSW